MHLDALQFNECTYYYPLGEGDFSGMTHLSHNLLIVVQFPPPPPKKKNNQQIKTPGHAHQCYCQNKIVGKRNQNIETASPSMYMQPEYISDNTDKSFVTIIL